MYVTFVSRMPPAACGVAEYTSMLIEHLAKRRPNLRITVLGGDVPELDFGLRYRDPYSGVEVCHCFRSGDVSYLAKCLAEVERPAIMHVQHEFGIFPNTKALASFMRQVRDLEIKVVLTLHTVVHASGGDDLIEAQRLLVDSSTAVIVHSVLQEYELLRQGAPEEKVYRIPHGTLLNPYIDTPKSKLLSTLPLPSSIDGKTIITVFGFVRHQDKDYMPVIKAVEILSTRYDVALVIAGTAQNREAKNMLLEHEIERLAREKGFICFIKDYLDRYALLRLLAASDIIVVPATEKQGYPIGVSGVLHLAIGSRKPVICTRSHKLIECNLIAPELTLHRFTVEDLVKKLSEVLENSEHIRAAVKKLWSYAQETSWDIIAEKHYGLYRKLLA
uniref:Glycosyltransferase subfamily 4-like N-terminal domain-containing protein n=1 Tax=Ignisphaera aggregans TaxID=334771 RepID=A0A7C2ZRT7_9CREN